MRTSLTILLSLLALVLHAQLHVPVDTVRMGRMYDTDADHTTTLSLRNIGMDTVAILDIRTSCACLDVSSSNMVVYPSDSTVITITYTPRGANGQVVKTLRVDTSGGKMVVPVSATVDLSEATVMRKFPVAIDSLRLSQVELSVVPHTTKFVRAYNGYSNDIELVINDSPSWAHPKVLKPRLKPGEQSIITVEFTDIESPAQISGLVIDPETNQIINKFNIVLITNHSND